jgi:hypothetical protein
MKTRNVPCGLMSGQRSLPAAIISASATRSWCGRLLALLSLCLAGFAFAPAAFARSALIDGDSVSGGASSPEAQAAAAQGFAVVVVSGATWDAMTAAQFGAYDLLICGDPSCGGLRPSVTANSAVWAPVVMGTAGGRTRAGNRIVVGTDPVLHGATATNVRGTIIRTGIAFAGKQPGTTGLYFCTSCDYSSHVATLATLSLLSTGTGTWTESNNAPCGGSVSLIAAEPSFTALTTASLQGWGCSVHETFPTFPTDWSALAVATDTATKPTCGVDPNTGLSACGQAYILIAGSSIIVVSGSISISPLDATNAVGTAHTVTAHVTSSGFQPANQVITFTVTGVNAGALGTCAPGSCLTDINGDVSFTYTDANGAGDDTIKASFTDARGSLQSATAQKHWIEAANKPPVARCKDVTVSAGAGCLADASIDAGSSDPDPGDTITVTQTPSGPYPIGTTSVTLTVTDNHGATSTCTATVTVVDNTPPAITCPSAVTVECNTSIDPSVTGTATATDNCGSPKVSYADSVGLGTCPNIKLIARLWTATDGAGNIANCVQTIRVVDTTPPTISGQGANATIECLATPVFTAPTAKDNCDPNPKVIVVSDVTTPGTCAGSYSRTITWVAQDCTGNKSAPVSQTITVVDTTPPTISGQGANATIECPAIPVFTAPTAKDNCDANPKVSVVSDVTTPGCGGTYSRTITWVAQDCTGNKSGTVSQTITVVDTTPPTITCPGNITHNTDSGVCSAILDPGTATATDTCSGVTVVGVRSDGAALSAPYPKGVTTITWTATDACGNHSSCTQTITVLDKEPPTVTCSVRTSTLWPPDHDLINVGLAASATDNCDGSGLPVTVQVFSDEDELAPASGNFSPDAKNLGVGTLRLRSERRGDADGRVYLIVTKVTDSSGNTGSCCSTVTVTHDQSAASIASVAAQAAAAQAYCDSHNGAPPPRYFVIGNGPIIGPKQ